MSKILVIADDLTGAAEIGGIAFQHGLSVRLIFETNQRMNYPEDVIILDSNTRSLSPEKAAERITGLITNVNFSLFKLIFKKVDSILRGPIESEIRAIMELMNVESAILSPANPSKNRIIREGKYYIDNQPINQTEFSHDPEYPRLSEEVKELITDSTDMVLTGTRDYISSHGKIMLPDISSEEDIVSLVSRAPDEGILWAGASDLFISIITSKFHLTRINNLVFELNSDIRYFVMGSYSENTKKMTELLSHHCYSVFYLPLSAINNEKGFDEWFSLIRIHIDSHQKIAVAGPREKVNDRRKVIQIKNRLVDVAKYIIGNFRPESILFIEGGETASSFVRVMGWNDLYLKYAWDEGAAMLIESNSNARIFIKPGSYKWPEEIFAYLLS